MAFTQNIVNLIGNVGQNPEIVEFENGNMIANFSIATTESYKPKDSEDWMNTTHWHQLRAYGKNAKTILNNVRQGHKLAIIGKLLNHTYEKDGVKSNTYYIQVNLITLLEKNTESLTPISIKKISSRQEQDNIPNYIDDIPF